MISRVGHVGLVVRDLERSIAFYEGLGLVLWKRMMRSGPYMDQLVGIPGVISASILRVKVEGLTDEGILKAKRLIALFRPGGNEKG